MLDLDVLVRDAQALAPLPATATRLIALVSNEDWDLDDVVQVVSLDPAITGRLLRVANSAASAAASRISTVADAVMRMGGGTVAQIATAAAVRGTIDAPLPVYGLAEGALWRHSVASALGVECLRAKSKVRVPPEAFTAALLHDIGKLVLGRRLLPESVRGVDAARSAGQVFGIAAENEVLGVNHAELGGLIAQHWRLPETIRLAISHHHVPEEVDVESAVVTVHAVHLADRLATAIGAGFGGVSATCEELEAQRAVLGITEEGWKGACEAATERLESVVAAYA
jgi:HD-like signal output (HDOD) protein